MVDFSKAEQTKNHRFSFEKTINSLNTYLEGLKKDYTEQWNIVENHRKERAALVEKLMTLVKNEKIKLNIPLNRCTHEELMQEMAEVIPKLTPEQQEKVRPLVQDIDNLFVSIQNEATKLEKIFIDLSDIRLKEADHDDEVIFVPKKKDKPPVVEAVLEEKKNDYPSIIENKDMMFKPNTIEKDTSMSNAIAEEIESILSSEVTPQKPEEEVIEVHDEKVEDIPYTLCNGKTFVEITENVYGDKDLWQDLYRYGSNKDVIDRKAQEYNVSVETAVKSPTILENTELILPTELTYIAKA